MTALSPAALVGTATAFLGLQDVSGGLIPGAVSDLVRRHVGARGSGRWDMALLHHWGHWSQFDHGGDVSGWPLIPTSEPAELAEYAQRRQVLTKQPLVGDVFLQFSPRRRTWVRGGIVAHVYPDRPHEAPYYDIMALEGSSGNAALAVGRAWPLFRRRLTRYATRLTADHDLRQDLLQEAMIVLWKIDPTRFDLRDREDVRYVRRAMKNKMRDVWRKEMLRGRDDAPLPALLSVGGVEIGPGERATGKRCAIQG